MATITSLAFAESTTSGTTVDTNAAVTVASGDWLVVMVACPNSGAGGAAPTVTVADSGGLNTYTQRASINRDPGASGDGATLVLFTSSISTGLTSGIITATVSDSIGSAAIQVYRMRPATGEVIAFVSADSTGDTGSASTMTNGTISVTNGDTIFGAASVETNGTATGDADAVNGSWSAVVNRVGDKGTDNTSSACVSQYKEVTATGSQSWSISYGGSHDYALSNLILRAAKVLVAAVGSYAITGTAASLEKSRFITAAAGSYAITGTDPTISYTGAKKVNAEPGIYDITGTDASTLQAWKPTAGAGSYVFTGTDPSTLHGYAVIPDAGSYVITGTDTPVLQARKVVPDAGSYAFSGLDQALVKSGTYVIVAGPGSYAFTGTDPTTIHGYVIAAGAGSYALTGTDATTKHSFTIFFDTPGSYLITGTGVTLTKTQAAEAPIIGTLRVASFSHSLVINPRPPSSIPVVSHVHSLQVDTRPPTVGASEYIFTIKVR